MNSRFDKHLKTMQQGVDNNAIKQAVNELHKSFATLTQEEQKTANVFLNDVQRGDVRLNDGKTFRQYISEYQTNAKHAQIAQEVNLLGKTGEEEVAAFTQKLNHMLNTEVTEANINEFGRFDEIKNCVDKLKAKTYFEGKKLEGERITAFKVNMKTDKLLQVFIFHGGVDL